MKNRKITCNSSRSRGKQIVLILLITCALALPSKGQNFTNPDLDGNAFFTSALPTGWDPVVVGDPVSLASNANIGDTPDLCSLTQPNIDTGLGGAAYSGNTFLTGLRMNGPSVDFHEGIEQTVSGLIIGESYAIEFYQAVVKQVFAIDESGSWSVYMDNTLLGITEPSMSALSFDDPDLNWDARSISFTPSSNSHTFKFMPTDDDSNSTQSFSDEEGALRMGIDLITINSNCTLDLGPSITLCETDLPFEIGTSLTGSYNWNTGDTTASIGIVSSGTYILEVTVACGLLVDSIAVEILEPLQQVDLGDDLTLCPDDFPVVLTADTDGEYFWSTFENTQSISVNEAGVYTVTVFNVCASVSDSIEVLESAEGPALDLGVDIIACEADFPITLDAGAFDSYVWSNGDTAQFISVNEPGAYSIAVTNACGTATDELTIELSEPPSPFSLGEDMALCENLFPIGLEVEATDLDIQWSTGSNEQNIDVFETGTYSVQLSNLCGSSTASIAIASIPNPVQEETLILCQGETQSFLGEDFSIEGSYQISVPSNSAEGCDTFWNIDVVVIPSDTLNQVLQIAEGETVYFNGTAFDQGGLYYITEPVDGACDQVVRILVEVEDEIFVYVPSAFTPDNDGVNDTFRPEITLVGDIELNYYEFEIYDRFGHLIYRTEDPDAVGWNGSGAIDQKYFVQDGIYTWVLRYRASQGADRRIEYGAVAIVR